MKRTNSLLENLDPRSKIISFLAIIFCMILTPITRLKDFGLYFLVILVMAFISRIPPRQLLKRVCVLIPFVLFIAMFVPFVKQGHMCWSVKIYNWELGVTYEGIWTFLNIVIKSSLSVLLLVIASSTTTFSDFLKGLDLLRISQLMIMITSFMYRYIFVLFDEAKRLMRARSIRYFGSRYKEQFRVIGYMIGVLFIRTYERAERIYNAMIVRGFNGKAISINHLRFSCMDFLFIAGIFISLIFIISGLIYKIEHVKINDTHLWHGL